MSRRVARTTQSVPCSMYSTLHFFFSGSKVAAMCDHLIVKYRNEEVLQEPKTSHSTCMIRIGF